MELRLQKTDFISNLLMREGELILRYGLLKANELKQEDDNYVLLELINEDKNVLLQNAHVDRGACLFSYIYVENIVGYYNYFQKLPIVKSYDILSGEIEFEQKGTIGLHDVVLASDNVGTVVHISGDGKYAEIEYEKNNQVKTHTIKHLYLIKKGTARNTCNNVNGSHALDCDTAQIELELMFKASKHLEDKIKDIGLKDALTKIFIDGAKSNVAKKYHAQKLDKQQLKVDIKRFIEITYPDYIAPEILEEIIYSFVTLKN
jgi:hypothetical protein